MPPPEPSSFGLPDGLLDRVLALDTGARRRLVAIAGTPAGGKSTLAAALTDALVAKGVRAANVPMDGFHLDNRLLDERGLRARKGAPETFDGAGFVALMRRLRTEEQVVYPVFDRGQDQAIAGAGLVPAECPLVVVEGNYLLFNEAPWTALTDIWDLSVWVETSEATVLQRCVQRWLDHGFGPDAARARAEQNDLPNARRVIAGRLPADIVVPEPQRERADVT
ncbi:nucleoside/nucleotide kinase family protein [Alphaproteobacteria bacterium GH1-50]|uniref:Nucleoside/nucleotide kinase family protein n=1 Tax=Kangsaoukella pontilimi TaxID=2691042 RepID=A0A7C9IMC1_9RHOB|nr:nucleoside/nucleotide kinase family protein [Kangsaoukella pontilimi]MXQ06590.1 nucleoside/nucleotide kinase family protein [Kangsaoukella pontilimi]